MSGAKAQRWLYFASLVLAAESIYMLPYMRRTFQTSMEDAFGLGAVDIGLLNSMFGLIALAAYFPGGWLADRISARKLLTFSLLSTGVGGLYMSTIPSHSELIALHAFWGMTSILTFWAALIKAVRNWGGAHDQGKGFGFLEAGRGIVAASLTTLATFAYSFGGTPSEGLIAVIYCYSAATIIAAALVWFLVPDGLYEHPDNHRVSSIMAATTGLVEWLAILSSARAWLIAFVVFCSYFLYLGTYEFPTYAERGFEQTKLFGAQLGTFRDWMRPLAAICAGLLADRMQPSRVIFAAFVTLLVTYASLAVLPANPEAVWLLWIQVAAAALAGFSLRAVYYALLQETGVPLSQTGMTVGFVSVVAYSPDLFAHTLGGTFVEWYGAIDGYRCYFGLQSFVALAGLFALRWLMLKTQSDTAHKCI